MIERDIIIYNDYVTHRAWVALEDGRRFTLDSRTLLSDEECLRIAQETPEPTTPQSAEDIVFEAEIDISEMVPQ